MSDNTWKEDISFTDNTEWLFSFSVGDQEGCDVTDQNCRNKLLNKTLIYSRITEAATLEISYNESTDEDIYFLDNKNFIQKKKRKDDHCYAAVNDINSSEDEFYNPKKRTKVTKLSKKK